MIIAGAGGHAIEILSILEENKFAGRIYFFDDSPTPPGPLIFNQYPVLTSIDQAREILIHDPAFILGVGKPAVRKILNDKMLQAGGQIQSVISPFARIGNNEVHLGQGLNIMTGAVITSKTSIGYACLIHVHCSIHHDTTIGEFCELSPGCRVLGNVKIGNFVSIGTGAILLPGIRIGSNAVIGAAAVVTKNVLDNQTVAGVPAKPIRL